MMPGMSPFGHPVPPLSGDRNHRANVSPIQRLTPNAPRFFTCPAAVRDIGAALVLQQRAQPSIGQLRSNHRRSQQLKHATDQLTTHQTPHNAHDDHSRPDTNIHAMGSLAIGDTARQEAAPGDADRVPTRRILLKPV